MRDTLKGCSRRKECLAAPMSELRQTLAQARTGFWGVALFTGVVNILMLTGPLFMLQVYDRVLASYSTPTLVVLFAIVVFLFALMGILDHVRGRVLARIGAGFQASLDDRVFATVLRQAETPKLRERPAGALRDLGAIQSLLGSAGTGAVFDLPWAPLYIAVMFLFHPWLGWFSVAGSVLVLLLAIVNQIQTKKPQADAARLTAEADARTEAARKAIETLRGLGMTEALSTQWKAARGAALKASVAASDSGGGLTAATKAVRLLLQSAVLALGAWLVLLNELTAGAMIAASILLGRALAPVEQLVGHWPQFQRAWSGWRDLGKLLAAVPPEAPRMALPRPEARLEVQDLVVVPPGETQPTLRGVSFAAAPGDAIAVIGPSASGKSSLARALAGVWPAARGEIRLGGADLPQYERDQLGRWLGYLPQEVYLFSGTVAQNVSRFAADATPEAIIAAAQQAAAHELILSLPQGYDTVLTEGGGRISGGQRQRIGLARAFYGEPVVLILDEPNASLDDPGVQALNKAIANARAAGKVVLVMSHRPSALAECNLVLILDQGVMRGFGPRDEVLSRFVKNVPAVLAPQRGTAAPA
jgi:PrtD family type I secretion system ABC transporter